LPAREVRRADQQRPLRIRTEYSAGSSLRPAVTRHRHDQRLDQLEQQEHQPGKVEPERYNCLQKASI
jgi:hypothetical protein